MESQLNATGMSIEKEPVPPSVHLVRVHYSNLCEWEWIQKKILIKMAPDPAIFHSNNSNNNIFIWINSSGILTLAFFSSNA